MRDPQRIHRLLAAVHNVWKANPDLRLGQILVNAASKAGIAVECPALFYAEDDRVLEGLLRFSTEDKPGSVPRFTEKADLWLPFVSGESIKGVVFRHNESVTVIEGEYKGVHGALISVESIEPEVIYRLERGDTGADVLVKQSQINPIGG